MGCCFSRPAGPNSPYPGGAPDASSRAINPSPLVLPEAVQPGAQGAPGRRRRRDPGPLELHINKPLRRHEWTSTRRQWTRRELAKERREFFETRVTGRPEIWQTLHAVLQVLWDPALEDSHDDGNELATAQTLLVAAEISLPTGDLVNGAYDSLGNFYQLPEWIVSNPDNMIDDGEGDAKGDLSMAEEDTAGEDDDADIDDAERRREEKGKGVLDEREMVTLRARLSENGQDVEAVVGKTDTVKSIIKKISDEASLSPTMKIRLAYMGKMLKENASLESQGWQSGHIINALVFERNI